MKMDAGGTYYNQSSVIAFQAGEEFHDQDLNSTHLVLLESLASSLHRILQSNNDGLPRGRTILTVLYLCVLALCFAVPVFYYCRMTCDDRRARQLRELELAGITQALEQSQNQHRLESRAARRKFREERKARIHQLFAPVKMTLTSDNFPHLCKNCDSDRDIEQGAAAVGKTSDAKRGASVKSIDEDQLMLEIPSPGFQFASTAVIVGQLTSREVPNLCTICLCNYYPGDSIVWSSNEACEHAFHEKCILQWLMKQREGPLCPCCRRDFVLDPYDVDDEDPSNNLFIAPIDDEEEGPDDNPENTDVPVIRLYEEDEVDSVSSGSDQGVFPAIDPAVVNSQAVAAEEASSMAVQNMEDGSSSSSSWPAEGGGSGNNEPASDEEGATEGSNTV